MRYIAIILMIFIFVGCANVDTPNYMEMRPLKESIKNNGYTNAKYKITYTMMYDGKKETVKDIQITTLNDDGTVFHEVKSDIPNTDEWKIDVLYLTDRCGLNQHLININIVNSYGKVHPRSKEILKDIKLKKILKI